MKLSIVFDDNPANPALKTGFGFACLVESAGEKILFDTGSDGEILLYNLKALGIKAEEIGLVVLSHEHWDHIDGLGKFLASGARPAVYLPASFTETYKQNLRSQGARVFEVREMMRITAGIHTTGEAPGAMTEQSLACETERGLALITGCAHPGIVRIIEQARKIRRDVHIALGGFHLRALEAPALMDIIEDLRRLGVAKVCPVHCSGDLTRRLFHQAYGGNCILGGAGTVIEID